MFWTPEDLNRGLCEVEDLGKPKPPPEPAPPAVIDPDTTLRQQLRNDSARAYAAVGGVDFLKGNPDLLAKLLVRSLPPEGVTDPNAKEDQPPMPAWVKAQRLAYRIASGISRDVDPDDDSPWINDPPALRDMIQAFLAAHPELYTAAQEMIQKLEATPPALPKAARSDPFAVED